MLTLREILLRTIEKNFQLTHEILSPVQIIRIAKEIEHRYSRAENPPTLADLDQLRYIFLSAEKNNTWHHISERMWKKACWLLWNGDTPLAANKIFLNKYIDFCNTTASSRLIKSLIHVYLRDFHEEMPGKNEVASFIRKQLHANHFKSLLTLWRERDNNYFLFDTRKDFSFNARDYIQTQENANDYLARLGLEGQLETANYAQELFKSVTHEVENNIGTSSLPAELLNKLKDLAIKGNELRYPQKKILIESLLNPWINKAPPADLCKQTLEFLLKYFYDPRTKEGRSNWMGVSEDALRVVKKWLAGATLEQFFEIIDNTAQDEHWRYRRKFWKAYYDSDCIDDAWIALGKDSRLEARSQSIDGHQLIAGSIKGRGVKPDHSVLIFKLGELTICEWSHVGKCRIWFERNNKSPRLYENSYLAEELREHEDYSLPHQSSKRHAWQRKLAEYIKHHTGIKMPYYRYEIS